jgi:hypothetical protein
VKAATEMAMKVTEDPRLIRDEVEVLFIATSSQCLLMFQLLGGGRGGDGSGRGN